MLKNDVESVVNPCRRWDGAPNKAGIKGVKDFKDLKDIKDTKDPNTH